MAYIREKVKKGNTYYYIVEGHRVNGQVKQTILEYIGPLEKLKEFALSRYLAKPKSDDMGSQALRDDIRSEIRSTDKEYANLGFKAYRHGAVSAMLWVAEQLGIEQILDETFKPKTIKGEKRSRLLLLAMIHRALEPGSKREFASWCQTTSLPYQLRFRPEDFDSAAFWEAMDLIDKDEITLAWNRIIERLIGLYSIDLRQFHLDYSNYFTFINTTNGRCFICKRGHNKQKRDDLLQFGLAALTTTPLNVPIVWQIYDGNVNDKSEFPVFTSHIREQLRSIGIDSSEVTITFDGGSNSSANFKDLGFHFVCSHSMTGHKHLYDIELSEYERITLANGSIRDAFFLESFDFSGVRGSGVLLYSEALKNGQLAQLERDVQAIAQNVEDVRNRLLNQRSSLYTQLRKRAADVVHAQRDAREYNEQLAREEKERLTAGCKRRGRARKPKPIPEWDADQEMLNIVSKAIYQKAGYVAEFSGISISKQDDGTYNLTWEIDSEAKDAYVSKYYGKKLVCTDHTDWTMLDILNDYIDQECIENGIFRTSKDVDHFAIRPQYHWTDDKIRVHVFICLTALTIAEVLRKHFECHDKILPKSALLDRLDEIHDGWVFVNEKKVERVLEKLDDVHQELWKIAELIKDGIEIRPCNPKTELGTT